MLVVLIMTQFVAQTLAFFLIQATSNRERGDSYYACATALVSINHYFIYVKRKTDIHKLFENFDEFIENSE